MRILKVSQFIGCGENQEIIKEHGGYTLVTIHTLEDWEVKNLEEVTRMESWADPVHANYCEVREFIKNSFECDLVPYFEEVTKIYEEDDEMDLSLYMANGEGERQVITGDIMYLDEWKEIFTKYVESQGKKLGEPIEFVKDYRK